MCLPGVWAGFGKVNPAPSAANNMTGCPRDCITRVLHAARDVSAACSIMGCPTGGGNYKSQVALILARTWSHYMYQPSL